MPRSSVGHGPLYFRRPLGLLPVLADAKSTRIYNDHCATGIGPNRRPRPDARHEYGFLNDLCYCCFVEMPMRLDCQPFVCYASYS